MIRGSKAGPYTSQRLHPTTLSRCAGLDSQPAPPHIAGTQLKESGNSSVGKTKSFWTRNLLTLSMRYRSLVIHGAPKPGILSVIASVPDDSTPSSHTWHPAARRTEDCPMRPSSGGKDLFWPGDACRMQASSAHSIFGKDNCRPRVHGRPEVKTC